MVLFFVCLARVQFKPPQSKLYHPLAFPARFCERALGLLEHPVLSSSSSRFVFRGTCESNGCVALYIDSMLLVGFRMLYYCCCITLWNREYFSLGSVESTFQNVQGKEKFATRMRGVFSTSIFEARVMLSPSAARPPDYRTAVLLLNCTTVVVLSYYCCLTKHDSELSLQFRACLHYKYSSSL